MLCRVSFLPLLPAPELTSLDHQVITTTGENITRVLSSFAGPVSYFSSSVTCPGVDES